MLPLMFLAGGSVDAAWHSMKTGEIFQTDGVQKIKPFQSGRWGVSGSLWDFCFY